MVIVAVGTVLFWAGLTAWAGSSLMLRAVTRRARLGGIVLMLTGLVGLVYGVRLLAS